VDLSPLGRFFQKLQLEVIIETLNDLETAALPDLSVIRKSQVSPPVKSAVVMALTAAGKRLAFRGQTSEGLRALELARELDSSSSILLDRILLTRLIPRRDSIEWKIQFHEMQRQLGCICKKKLCGCRANHFETAHMSSSPFPEAGSWATLTLSAASRWCCAWARRRLESSSLLSSSGYPLPPLHPRPRWPHTSSCRREG
jgi:hypothetical protein